MRAAKTICFVQGMVLILCLLVPNGFGANLLGERDPGFESSANNGTFPSSGFWQQAWSGGSAGALCTSTAARTGFCGLWEYTGTLGTEWWCGPYQDISAVYGDVFAASAWARSQSSWVAGSKAVIQLSFLDASRNVLTTLNSSGITAANSGWQNLSVTSSPAPLGTSFIRYRLYLEKPNGVTGQSIANFDDCNLEKTVSAQPSLQVKPAILGFGNDLTTQTFTISNAGSGTLTWTLAKSAAWLSVFPTNGTTTTETDTISVTVNRTGLTSLNNSAAITINSDGGTTNVQVFMQVASGIVPSQPAVVAIKGYQMTVRKRLANGTLDQARPYVIKGAAWTPASIGTTSLYYSRRAAFADWYRLDIQLLKEMNANTVYMFLDPGTDQSMIAKALAVLDCCYRNDIMVIMTVDEDGSDNTANISQVIAAFKNHPAILMWALGNEWNLWRPDRPLYYAKYSTLGDAATAMQSNALLVKSLDTNHPVTSILGEINYPTQTEVSNIVCRVCAAVDVWGANIYRGPEFYALFSEWKTMSAKPLFLSEFGTDAFRSSSWWPVAGYEDQSMQEGYIRSLWSDLAQELSANDTNKVCLGGTVFEWNDEWWKTSTGNASVHDPDGYETTWNPIAHPDGFANEEWFGIVSVNRERRLAYYTLQSCFAFESGLPSLSAVRQGNSLILSWATNATVLSLIKSTNILSVSNWTAVSPAPVVVNGRYIVTNALGAPNTYYRLRSQ